MFAARNTYDAYVTRANVKDGQEGEEGKGKKLEKRETNVGEKREARPNFWLVTTWSFFLRPRSFLGLAQFAAVLARTTDLSDRSVGRIAQVTRR